VTAETWADRYEGRAVCPDGHEFVATWLDATRAAQTCPTCGRTFVANWPGFAVEPETVVVYPPGQEPGRGAA
jgi:RNA polymerase subunit RPABC4/transcription elongation factor Spt4